MSENSTSIEYHYFSRLLKYMKANSTQKIIDNLTLLKKDPKCSKILLKSGNINLLIKCLSYQNISVLNLTLSILADVCLYSDVREVVQETKIIEPILWIINNLKMDTTLHCRACRLIGNLCESTYHAKLFYNAGAVKSLASLLNEKPNTAINLMAVRAIRNIWHNCDKSREDIINRNIISNITQLFKSTINESQEEVRSDITEACLKAFSAFLSNFDLRVVNQLCGKNGLGYQTLIKHCELNNKLAIKCLYRLCQIAECRPDLAKYGAVEIMASLVSKKDTCNVQTLSSLCLFCREAVNRFRVKQSGGLELMLAFLRNPQYESQYPLLLHTLTTFVNDDESIAIMVKNGLVDIITERLKLMTMNSSPTDAGEEKVEKEVKIQKRRRESTTAQISIKSYMIKASRYSLDYYRDDWSPRSSTSGCYSPPSSPPTNITLGDSEIDDSAEENYSPVCSDHEFVEENEELQEDEEEEEEEELDSAGSCESISHDVMKVESCSKETESHIDNCTLVLLSRLTYIDGPVEKLADPCIIKPLVSYIRIVKNSKALHILVRIARNGVYLTSLVKQGFVFEAQTMYGSDQFTRHLCNLAATGGAIGELTTILLRGQELHKYITAVSIPFLITSKHTLRCLLNDHGGLPLIFQILNDRENQLYEKAIWSICRLANALEIRPETVEKGQTLENISITNDEENIMKSSTVTFELDDGTTVEADRKILCQKSDAFTAMLEGNFKESGKERVKLKNTSKEGLNALLHALDGTMFQNVAIESLLDAVLLADKFLMSNISDMLTESSISKLNHENYSRAWNWARKNSCFELKTCCVKSFLTTKMTCTERTKAFHDFSNGENFTEFLEEVREIINSVLCQR